MYDEPTAGLDPVASTVVEDLIRSLHTPVDSPNASSSGGAASSAGQSCNLHLQHVIQYSNHRCIERRGC